ncbi:MAG: nuclear transport factor 2 family protein [Saprospiraceae bacterium]
MKFSLFVFILFFSSNIAFSQDHIKKHTSDKVMIETTIQNYFDGWMTGDTILLSKAMHSTCNLKFIRDNKLVMMNKQKYIGNFKPRPKLNDTEGRIISINITRTAAAAKVEIETPKRHFTDYFNLLKEGGQWYITDKISTSVGK